MSGPTTVLVHPGQILAVLLAASAIRAARAVHQAHADAAALRQTHEQERRTDSQRQAGAHEQGLTALLAQADALEERLAQLAELSQRLGDGQALQAARPARPQSNDYLSLADYVRAIEAFATDAQSMLMTALAERPAEDDEPGALAEWLTAPAAQAVPATLSARLLRRIAHLGPPPADIQALTEELDRTVDGSRARLLASELRRRIQLHAEKTLQDEVRRAQALVVEQSLQDLGYQVKRSKTRCSSKAAWRTFAKATGAITWCACAWRKTATASISTCYAPWTPISSKAKPACRITWPKTDGAPNSPRC